MSHRSKRRLTAGLFVAATVAMLVPVTAASAAPSVTECETRNNNTYERLLECVTVDGVLEHLAAFQSIADLNGGTRAEGTPGYERSVEYVRNTLSRAGWRVSVVPFVYQGSTNVLEQLTPVAAEYPTGNFTGADEGEATGPVIPIDLALDPPRASSSGCEPEDFAGVDLSGSEDIVLIQRGTCPFGTKALNAEAAGAEAVIIFNQGDSVGAGDRFGLIVGTLGGADIVDIPVVGASFDQGVALAQEGSTAHILVETFDVTSHNVIAELRGKVAGNVVMAGAHLDSVPAGPGINDNGSGSATLLEIAQNLGKHKPFNTLRFAWWGNEESGLVGSTAWVNDQPDEVLDQIAMYMNFDMVGSPNHIYMVYDADESTFPAPVVVPPGSTAIEDTFESFYTWKDVPYDDTAFSGRSDYQAFINNGIPSSGLFTGAEEPKTAEQVAIWGGIEGEQLDPCYHEACDDIDNLNLEALDINADAIAFATLTYAYSTQSVNGVRGTVVPGRMVIPPPAGEQGTTGG